MCVLLPACGSRGGVEPLAGFAVRLRVPGAEVRACAPPDQEFTSGWPVPTCRADPDAFCAQRLHATSDRS